MSLIKTTPQLTAFLFALESALWCPAFPIDQRAVLCRHVGQSGDGPPITKDATPASSMITGFTVLPNTTSVVTSYYLMHTDGSISSHQSLWELEQEFWRLVHHRSAFVTTPRPRPDRNTAQHAPEP